MINQENVKRIKRNWILRNQDYHRKLAKEYRKKYPEKIHAHNLSQSISLKDKCEICGISGKLERHHWRYDKPLLINSLCNFCHITQHRNVGNVGRR